MVKWTERQKLGFWNKLTPEQRKVYGYSYTKFKESIVEECD